MSARLREARLAAWTVGRLALALLLVAVYVAPHTWIGGALGLDREGPIAYGALRVAPFLAVAGACAVALACWWAVVRRSPDALLLLALLGVFWLAVVVDGLCVRAAPNLLLQSSLVLSTLTVGLLAALLCGSAEAIIGVLAAAGAAGAAYGLWYYGHGLGIVVSGTVLRSGGLYASPLEFAYVLLACLPAAVYWATRRAGAAAMAFGVVATAAMLPALVLTFGRTALVAAAVAGSFAALRQAASRRTAVAAIVVMALVCAAALGYRTLGPINARSVSRSGRGHLATTLAEVRAFGEHPLTGVGFAQAASWSIAGDLPAQWLAGMGTGGGVLLVGLALAIGRCLRGRSALTTAIGSAFLAIAVAGATDTPFGSAATAAPTCAVGMLLGAALTAAMARSRDAEAHNASGAARTAGELAELLEPLRTRSGLPV